MCDVILLLMLIYPWLLVSGSAHPHRRTRSESDLKRVSLPDAKRVKVDKTNSPVLEEPPNSRKPPEVYMCVCVCQSSLIH